jgi:L-rhamnose mutarotase
VSSDEPKNIQRYGQVIGLKREKRDHYRDLHANPWPGINEMLTECNVRNFSIYECELAGELYLFGYFEYVGDDFAADMTKMEADPKTQEWLAETDPCQVPLRGIPEGGRWKLIEEIYHLD